MVLNAQLCWSNYWIIIVNIFVCITIMKSQIIIISHCLGLGKEGLIFAVCHAVSLLIWIPMSPAPCLMKRLSLQGDGGMQYIPRNMHTVFTLMCFVVVIHWLIFPYPPGLLRWHCGNLTIAPVPAKQPWWIWINTSCEIIMNDYITTTKQSTTKPCAYILVYTVYYIPPNMIRVCFK